MSQAHTWFPTPLFAFPSPHAKQLLLSGEGSNPVAHWQVKAVGSALMDTLTALAKHEQWLEPGSVELLRRGQGKHWAVSLMVDLKVVGVQRAQMVLSLKTIPVLTMASLPYAEPSATKYNGVLVQHGYLSAVHSPKAPSNQEMQLKAAPDGQHPRPQCPYVHPQHCAKGRC